MLFFLLCGISSQKPDLPVCYWAILFECNLQRQLSEKTTSEATLGSSCLASLIPDQSFIFNATLFSVRFLVMCDRSESSKEGQKGGWHVKRRGKEKWRPSGKISKLLKWVFFFFSCDRLTTRSVCWVIKIRWLQSWWDMDPWGQWGSRVCTRDALHWERSYGITERQEERQREDKGGKETVDRKRRRKEKMPKARQMNEQWQEQWLDKWTAIHHKMFFKPYICRVRAFLTDWLIHGRQNTTLKT